MLSARPVFAVFFPLISNPMADITKNVRNRQYGRGQKINNRSLVRWKRTAAGKLLCRILGEEKGAVTIEHIIVAFLIVAACIVALAMFGMTIMGMFFGGAKDASEDNSEANTSEEQTLPFRK